MNFVSPANGQVIKYDTTSSKWINSNDIGITQINNATDFDNTVVKNENDWMCWNNSTSKWEPRDNTIVGLSDVNDAIVPLENDALWWNDTLQKYEPRSD